MPSTPNEPQALPLVILGTGELGQIVAAALAHEGRPATAFTVHSALATEDRVLGLEVIPFEQLGERFAPGTCDVLVTVGYTRMNQARQQLCEQVLAQGYSLGSYVSRLAHVLPHVELGHNVIVLEGALVQSFCSIGNGCILWSGAHVAHHSTVAEWSFLAPRVAVAGNVRIGHHSFLGINSTVRDGLTLAPFSLIGAGAVVLHDTQEHGLYPGTPAVTHPTRTSADVEL